MRGVCVTIPLTNIVGDTLALNAANELVDKSFNKKYLLLTASD
jgi:hypothetical protein